MRVDTVYSKFNSLIKTAEIPINLDKSFRIELVDSDTPDAKLLEIKAENTMLHENIVLQMTFEEAKQFNLLIAQFLRQL